MADPQHTSDLLISGGVGVLSVFGYLAKGSQWQDPKTGRISTTLMISGISLCLIMATVVRAGGVHFGVEPWVQCAVSGVFCYLGPDPILRALGKLALNKIGVPNDAGNDDKH